MSGSEGSGRFQPGERARRLLYTAAGFAIGVSLLLLHAKTAREHAASHADESRALVEATGLPDLALSSHSRWLRHPSHSEWQAAMSDAPATLDVDPAGALIRPPRALHTSAHLSEAP